MVDLPERMSAAVLRGPGQLEGEIQANGWLVAPADAELVFGPKDAEKWEGALRRISIDPRLLSPEGGRA